MKKERSMNKEPWYLQQLTQDELKVFIEEARAGKNNNQAFIGIERKITFITEVRIHFGIFYG